MIDYGIVVRNMRLHLTAYIRENGLKSLVIGESGGIDSAVTTVLAKPVCDGLNIPLIGRSITIETNKPDEELRARLIGEQFCSDFREVNLTLLYHAYLDAIGDDHEVTGDRACKIRLGNIKVCMLS